MCRYVFAVRIWNVRHSRESAIKYSDEADATCIRDARALVFARYTQSLEPEQMIELEFVALAAL